MTLAEQIKQKARELGFSLVGITSAQPSQHTDYFRQWLADGKAGEMHYLTNRFAERTDPSVYFPGVRSIICVAANYRPKLDAVPPGHGRIARYALGDDYHVVLKDRLFALADWLRSQVPEVQTRCSVDTAPVMEKELAARAGIGWMGKNTCIINHDIGSFILLGQLLTNLDLPIDGPATDRCANCTRCIDACPTQAINAPYQLDASRCVSYLTIEHRSEIASELQEKIGDWMYGCDICQEVCPWNRRSPVTDDPAFQPRFATGSLDWQEVQQWQDENYRRAMKNSAIKRVKLPILKRNAEIVGKNKSLSEAVAQALD